MSELIQQKNIRLAKWRLLTGVSALVLVANAALPDAATAEESDRPTFWIELGAQLEKVDGGQSIFSPSFLEPLEGKSGFPSLHDVERPARYSNGFEGKAAFTPEGSPWLFSASVRYGRSNAARAAHAETSPGTPVALVSIPLFHLNFTNVIPPHGRQLIEATHKYNESHLVVDFSVGRDVGIGLFGGGGSSNINFGLRFAQFSTKSSAAITADPDFHFSTKYASTYAGFPAQLIVPQQFWHVYKFVEQKTHSFHGMGPSLSWNGSARLVGEPESVEVNMDLGINAAVLFGRQRSQGQHKTTANDYHYSVGYGAQTIHNPVPSPVDHNRSRSVAIPNLGGFVGLSLKFPNAKVSLGYRADVFFGAVDGGIDARKTYDRSLYGPFANFSIGL
jgi:hypothetical protein